MFKQFNINPGIVREQTELAAEGNWYDADKVRFKMGKPQAMRGWQRKTPQFLGTARNIITWSDLISEKYMAWGTESKLYVYEGDTYSDITPIVSTVTITNKLNTTTGSTKIVVSIAGHPENTGDYIYITSMAATVGGNVFLSGGYQVSVIGTDSFAIDFVSLATATSGSTGVATVNYLLATGSSLATEGTGYGTGPYGVSTYGTPRSGTGFSLQMRQWSLDTWGEDLIANPRGGAIYVWVQNNGQNTRAQIVSAAPSVNDVVIVSPVDRHMLSFGCADYSGNYDPMLLRWCSQNDYNDWTASIANTAGAIRMGAGSQIIGAKRSKTQINVWTDEAMHGVQFVGAPAIFQINQVGANCGLIGPHAATELNGGAIWMGPRNFHNFNNVVAVIPCPIQRYIFDDINLTQAWKIYAGVNSEFNEVIWLYCSSNSTECDRYAIYNPVEGHWTFGTTKWTCWEDLHTFNNIITGGSDQYIYDNEPEGVYSGDGVAYESFVESAAIDLEDGDQILYIDRCIPDFVLNTGEVVMRLIGRRYPNGAATTKGPYTIDSTTESFRTRLRARQVSIKITSSTVSDWRLGATRFNIQPDGLR